MCLYLLNAYQVFDFPSEILLPINPVEERNSNLHHLFIPVSKYERLINAIRLTINVHRIDLIIMGTRGENNHSIMEIGSNAVELMENINQCPIMAVPQKANVFIKGNKKEIVFSTNFKTSHNQKDLEFLLEAARLYRADIRVLHIQEDEGLSPKQLENKNLLKECLKDVRHSFHTLSHIKVASGIHSFIESRGSDMLAMILKSHSFFNSIFSPPLIELLHGKQQVPLLVRHE